MFATAEIRLAVCSRVQDSRALSASMTTIDGAHDRDDGFQQDTDGKAIEHNVSGPNRANNELPSMLYLPPVNLR